MNARNLAGFVVLWALITVALLGAISCTGASPMAPSAAQPRCHDVQHDAQTQVQCGVGGCATVIIPAWTERVCS